MVLFIHVVRVYCFISYAHTICINISLSINHTLDNVYCHPILFRAVIISLYNSRLCALGVDLSLNDYSSYSSFVLIFIKLDIFDHWAELRFRFV